MVYTNLGTVLVDTEVALSSLLNAETVAIPETRKKLCICN